MPLEGWGELGESVAQLVSPNLSEGRVPTGASLVQTAGFVRYRKIAGLTSKNFLD